MPSGTVSFAEHSSLRPYQTQTADDYVCDYSLYCKRVSLGDVQGLVLKLNMVTINVAVQ